MSKALKEMMFSHYDRLLGGRDSLLFVDSAKIPAEDVRALRTRLREQKVLMLVVANKVFDKVLEKHGISGFRKTVNGQIAVLYSEEEGGAMRAARIVADWNKKKKNSAVLGGLLEGAIADANEAGTWKDLPTRDEQLSIIAGQIMAMAGRIASQIEEFSKGGDGDGGEGGGDGAADAPAAAPAEGGDAPPATEG
ncbi:MAG: 50S ribosomal protein L10 [Planctomycetota bacterium]